MKSDKQITRHSASESKALGYTFIKHCTTTIIGKEKGRNQWKSPIPLTLMTISLTPLTNRVGFEACTLHHWIICMLMFQKFKHDVGMYNFHECEKLHSSKLTE